MSVLNAKHFHDEEAAFAKLESIVWPDGPVCPHCGALDRIYALKGVRSKPSKKHPQGIERFGLKKCGHCRKQFTARVGTLFESSHIPLHKWFQAAHLLCSSKKGISSHQLHRILQISYEAAWFCSHRLREAMRRGPLAAPFGGGQSNIVEVDETFIGKKEGEQKGASGFHHKNAVLTLVDRRTGEARSVHIDKVDAQAIVPIVRQNVERETAIVTDEARHYHQLNRDYFHASVNHGQDEWVVDEFHTNTVEGFFSIFKRGMKGVYQHCSEKHLHRYLAEFDFRYSNRSKLGIEDEARTTKALQGIKGRRLTYRGTDRSGPETPDENTPPF